MIQDSVLGLIWQGAIQPARGTSDARFARMLRALIPVHAVLLTATQGIDRVALLLDETEVLPSLPLGDVLVEELGLDVPYGALIVLREPDLAGLAPDDGELSYDLGLVSGEVLLAVLRSGLFPMVRETDALYLMACGLDRLVDASGYRHLGIGAPRFRQGLAGALGAYWSGARSRCADESGLFEREDFLRRPELLTYLSSLDGNFLGRRPTMVPIGLMHAPGGVRSFDEWLVALDRSIRPFMGESRLSDGRDRFAGIRKFNLP